MAEKLFISADSLQLDSYRLAKQVYDSGFKPSFMVALWRGGTPVGCYVQEFLKTKGIKADHIATRTSRYTGIEEADEIVRIHGLDYIVKRANNTDRLLIIDDVFDSGKTIEALIEKLKNESRANTSSDIRVASVYYKPLNNRTKIKPDFYVHETDKWLVFPHELEGLSLDEIATGKGKEIADLLK
ncbi:MAG: phosphoribosyltransferase family protein [Candidatus Nanoarchaeia archaeon]|nr:phosphoribosyltransferase family protein [Candidatus Nanoarchaeia archaeon]